MVVAAEIQLLRNHGHTVIPFERHNDELKQLSPVHRIGKAIEALWSVDSYRAVRSLITQSAPDVAHFHNTFPLISPSSYYACADAGVPVVQTLHNYRLLCPSATLLRDGHPCEACVGRAFAWPGVFHRCYHESISKTGVAASMIAAHRVLRTWQTKVARYIALTEVAKSKFVHGGLPPDRVVLKPNFVSPDPGPKKGPGEYALFVGRLSPEKGLNVLLEAWSRFRLRIPLKIVGDGALRAELEARTANDAISNVRLVGVASHDEVLGFMKNARFLVCPSLWFEGFPMIVAEAFACALPIVVSRLGSLEELIAHESTGVHFEPGDAQSLALAAERLWMSPSWCQDLGRAARREFLQKYTAERNYEQLVHLYESVANRVPAAE